MTEAEKLDVWNKLESMAIPEPNSGCLLWMHTVRRGYGRVSRAGVVVSAHRLAFEVTKGPIPDGLEVCHKCDVRSCINPDHLFAGTKQDNMDDMKRKGRAYAAKGEANRNAKLTAKQVAAIIVDQRDQAAIAADYGMSRISIGYIKRGLTWRNIQR